MSLKGRISRLPEQPCWLYALDCSTAALTTSQKVLPVWKLVELKMLDFSNLMRTGISILTLAADMELEGITQYSNARWP